MLRRILDKLASETHLQYYTRARKTFHIEGGHRTNNKYGTKAGPYTGFLSRSTRVTFHSWAALHRSVMCTGTPLTTCEMFPPSEAI